MIPSCWTNYYGPYRQLYRTKVCLTCRNWHHDILILVCCLCFWFSAPSGWEFCASDPRDQCHEIATKAESICAEWHNRTGIISSIDPVITSFLTGTFDSNWTTIIQKSIIISSNACCLLSWPFGSTSQRDKSGCYWHTAGRTTTCWRSWTCQSYHRSIQTSSSSLWFTYLGTFSYPFWYILSHALSDILFVIMPHLTWPLS